MAVIRVAFQSDITPATAGDGSFVLEDTVDLDCTDWSLDPAPHNRAYFQDHLIAAGNYWQRVSDGQIEIDLARSDVYPLESSSAYELPHDMLYYHPYLEDYDETAKLFELSRDALELADPDIDFSAYSTVIMVHAGMGGDFAFALDPTPGNIPSAYLGTADFQGYGVLQTAEKTLDDLIIIPESQNFLQYKETRSLFEDSEDPCFYQVGLNGTLALMLGFHLGLPPLYDTETGRSLIGGFALMDQGSNNFHGVAPAYPNPCTRIQEGWTHSVEKTIGDTVAISVSDPPVRISISDTEYYLIENRQRNQIEPSDMIVWIDEAGYDTVSVELSAGGVVLQVDEQHAGLPGNGIYIWHIDEEARYTADNPNGGSLQFIDFLEADGAQDMGHTTQLLFASFLETGWWFDPWFAGNEGWFHLNRDQEIVGDSLLHLDSKTFPSTISNSGILSHLRIENISKNGSIMSFSISSERQVDQSLMGDILGWGNGDSSLWAFSSDNTTLLEVTFPGGQFTSTSSALVTPALIYEDSIDSTVVFRYPWIVTHLTNGTRFRHIETGAVYNHWAVYDPYEISVNGDQVTYLAENDTSAVIVYWNAASGQRTTTVIFENPWVKFSTTSGTQIMYGLPDSGPTPVAVTHNDKINPSSQLPDQLDMLQWTSSSNVLLISQLPGSEARSLDVSEPTHIIPLDADDDGRYEIALFYENMISIMNQGGTRWNGSPFSVEPYYGNPLIATFGPDELAIFLRHADSYGLYALDGHVLDRGVLPPVSQPVINSMGTEVGLMLVLSGDMILYFENETIPEGAQFWTDPQGCQQGDRLVVLRGESPLNLPNLKKGSVYNYPNPIKGKTTTIRAWIGNSDTWTVEIFSMNGAQVAYHEEAVRQNNTYNEWVWDASQVSNGVYLAQISSGGDAEIIKIAIIR